MISRIVFLAFTFGLRVGTRLIRLSSRVTRLYYRRPQHRRGNTSRVWIDVGAHRGELTFDHALMDPEVCVYAFEPDISVASHRYGLLDNFVVFAISVSDHDGFADFHTNSNDRTSSLLPFDEKGIQSWHDIGQLHNVGRTRVPTIRLDTFLDKMGIEQVEYLKIDAQGHDFEVISSLGERIRDIETLRVEACAVAQHMYKGAHNAVPDIVEYMQTYGFALFENLPETYGQEANLVFRRRVAKD